MLLTIKRTFREAVSNFFRNGWLTLATISVLILSLYFVGMLYVVSVTGNHVLKNVQDKVSVSVYFKSDVSEESILKVKDEMQNAQEIKSIEYISKEKALENFKRDNVNESVITESLKEIGENPLLSALVIKANGSEQYETIANYVNESSFKDDVSRVNYGKNKEIINRLNGIIFNIRKIGLVLGSVFGLIAILITFNTIRITIYTHKSEIEVMRLVGASNMFIRLPFIFEGIIYGLVSSIISMLVLFITIKIITPYVLKIMPFENLTASYLSNFWMLLEIEAIIGVFLGVFSSLIAIRKYLKF